MTLRRLSTAGLLDATFLAGFLAYVYWGIDTRLIHHWQAPAFYWTAGYAGQGLSRPVEYLYSLIAQSYVSAVWGAVVLTAQAALILGLAGRIGFVPIILALYRLSRYSTHGPLLLEIALAAAVVRVSKRWWLPVVERLPGRKLRQHWLWGPAAIAALAAMSIYCYRANDRDRRLALVDYHAAHENWSELLAAANWLRSADFNSLTRYEVNLALHETRRLGDEMFRYPQSGSTMPALRTETFLPYMLRVTDLLLRLGRVNDAEHFGNEARILGDSDPRVMRLLADVEIAKGQPEAARKYLAILSTEAGSAAWARDRLERIDDERTRVSRVRNVRDDDFIPVWQNPEKPGADVNRLLLDQLDADPTNRMAFEFLMGNYLIARDLNGARALMPRIARIDYGGRTPRHYQEAMAMYADGTGQPVVIEGVTVESDTLNRMAVFKRLMSQSAGREAAMRAAWDRFRDSYFFYFVFGPGDYR
jgi:hypothetical protein